LSYAAKQAKKHSMRNSFHLCLADAHHSFSAFSSTQPPCCSFCDNTQVRFHCYDPAQKNAPVLAPQSLEDGGITFKIPN